MKKLARYLLTLGTAFVLTACAGQGTHAAAPAAVVCHFDGGGTLRATEAARTSDGHVWACTEDGRLERIR